MKQDLASSKTKYNIEALSRGLEILSLFNADRPKMSFTQIVETVGLNKSTVFRVLATLESAQYLEQDTVTRLYRPGIRVLQLGFTAINSLEISQIARPYLENLSQKLGETVSLAVLDDFYTIYIDRIRNQSIVGVVLKIGSRLPAHCSSLGKVLLADLPNEKLEELLARHELNQFTPKTLATREGLFADLELTRKRGYAFGDEELVLGLRAVAAPIRDSSGRAIAAVNVTGQIQHLDYRRLDDEIRPALLETVRIISILLGFTSKWILIE